MVIQMTQASKYPRSLWRSTGAILLGFVAVVVLSLGTDQVLHVLEVYPPWGQPMRDEGDNILALAYRCVYAVLGSYIAARFAPRNPVRHALILGVIGFVLSLAGATELFDEDWTGGETLNTAVFTEQNGKTTLTNTVRYSSRDGALNSGMTQGVAASYDRLTELLAPTLGDSQGEGE